MKIQIRASNIQVSKALRAHVELRLGFALSRFGEQVGRVAVQLSNSEEHPDSKDRRCRIAIGLPRCVKVQETDADVFEAVARAADRAARSVARAIEQERTGPPRTSQPWKDKRPRSDAARLLVPIAKPRRSRATALKRRYSSSPLHK